MTEAVMETVVHDAPSTEALESAQFRRMNTDLRERLEAFNANVERFGQNVVRHANNSLAIVSVPESWEFKTPKLVGSIQNAGIAWHLDVVTTDAASFNDAISEISEPNSRRTLLIVDGYTTDSPNQDRLTELVNRGISIVLVERVSDQSLSETRLNAEDAVLAVRASADRELRPTVYKMHAHSDVELTNFAFSYSQARPRK